MCSESETLEHSVLNMMPLSHIYHQSSAIYVVQKAEWVYEQEEGDSSNKHHFSKQ